MSTAIAANTAANQNCQARNVSKVFKRDAFEVKAPDDVPSIARVKGAHGPSGSGKTTLLNMIAAIDRPGRRPVLGENVFRSAILSRPTGATHTSDMYFRHLI
jgi:ABC-type Fe3+/spermidine/putrescine transport system ATPase subunit